MHGLEWVIEAQNCRPDTLRTVARLQSLFDAIVAGLDLHPVGETRWHQFPGTGGITGLCLLAESHLAVHTFPEHGSLCLNLFCCRPRPEWDFEAELRVIFGAQQVSVRRIQRPYSQDEEDVLLAVPNASEVKQ